MLNFRVLAVEVDFSDRNWEGIHEPNPSCEIVLRGVDGQDDVGFRDDVFLPVVRQPAEQLEVVLHLFVDDELDVQGTPVDLVTGRAVAVVPEIQRCLIQTDAGNLGVDAEILEVGEPALVDVDLIPGRAEIVLVLCEV